MSLDFSPDQFKSLLAKCGDILTEWYDKRIRNQKIYYNHSPAEIQSVFDEPLPETGTSPELILEKVRTELFDRSNFNPSPNYYGYITGGGNQMGILAELLKAGLNQNNLKWHSAPANSEIEKLVIRWLCEFIGYPINSGGVLVSGGSVANFLNLAVMRKIKSQVDVAQDGIYGSPKMTVYVSEQGHSSIDKAVDMLGMGKKYLRKIPVNDQFQIRTDLLEEIIKEDRENGFLPGCIIGIAGTTNNGAVDPLRKLGEIARINDMWYMIDGAYGLPGAGTKLVSHLYEGVEMADSILLNPHKWFFVPFEVSAVIVKNKTHLKNTFSLVPDYLRTGYEKDGRDDLMDVNLQLSKDFKALKVWMTFKTYGAENLRFAIENDCKMARYAVEIIETSDDFELLAPAPLSIVCFRFLGEKGRFSENEEILEMINKKIIGQIEKDGRIFFAGTKIHGKTSLRINLTNHRRTKADIEFLFKVLREISEKIN